jgi:hypothetical protein
MHPTSSLQAQPLPPAVTNVSVSYPRKNPIIRDLSLANNKPNEETISLRQRSPFEISMKESRQSNDNVSTLRIILHLTISFFLFYYHRFKYPLSSLLKSKSGLFA